MSNCESVNPHFFPHFILKRNMLVLVAVGENLEMQEAMDVWIITFVYSSSSSRIVYRLFRGALEHFL